MGQIRPEVADLAQGDRPREEKGDLEIEDDEQQRDKVETNVELAPRVLERLEATLVGRELFGVGMLPRDDVRGAEEGDGIRA